MLKSKFIPTSALVAASVSTLLVTPVLAKNTSISPVSTTGNSAPSYIIAQTRRAFTVTDIWSDHISIKSVATGNVYNVYYASRIGAEVGDTVTITSDGNDNWITIINERTGLSAVITDVYKQ